MLFGPTQAVCGNEACGVITWVPRLPDGGMSNPSVLDLEDFETEGEP